MEVVAKKLEAANQPFQKFGVNRSHRCRQLARGLGRHNTSGPGTKLDLVDRSPSRKAWVSFPSIAV